MLKDISTQCPLQGTEEFHSTQHPWRPGSDAWLASRRKAHWAAEELRDSQVLRLWKLQHPAELVGHCSPCSIEISVLSYSDVWPAAPVCRSGFTAATAERLVHVLLGHQPGNAMSRSPSVSRQTPSFLLTHLRTHCTVCRRRFSWLLQVSAACSRWDERDSVGLWETQ